MKIIPHTTVPLWAAQLFSPIDGPAEAVGRVGLVIGWTTDDEPAPVVVVPDEDCAASVWRTTLDDGAGDRVMVTLHLERVEAEDTIPASAIR